YAPCGFIMRMTTLPVPVFLCMIVIQSAWIPGGLMNSSPEDSGSYDEEILAWRKSRVQDLTGEDGWLALAGLYWLHSGKNTFGCGSSGDIVLPPGKAPGNAGSIIVTDGSIRIEAAQGAGITSDGKPVTALELHSDAAGHPTVLKLGSLSFHVIKRGNRLGLRVR